MMVKQVLMAFVIGGCGFVGVDSLMVPVDAPSLPDARDGFVRRDATLMDAVRVDAPPPLDAGPDSGVDAGPMDAGGLCSDGVQNGTETGVDCGGSCAPCFDCAAVTIQTVECEALVALYQTANGAGWSQNTGWLVDADPCAWFGITCQANRVSALDLSNNGLDGTIPSNIGALSRANRFRLDGNALGGVVPQMIMQVGVMQMLIRAQSRCLTPENMIIEDWLSTKDPEWNDGC